MTKEQYAAWAAALRSGKREQGSGALRHNDKHCCLGVLARDVLKLRLGKLPSAAQNARIYDAVTRALGDFATVENYFRMNDSQKMPFEKIAERIERHVAHSK